MATFLVSSSRPENRMSDMEHGTSKLPHFWWDADNTCCFAALRMNYGLTRFIEGRRFVKLLLEWKLRNVMYGNVLHIAVSRKEALGVLRPANMDGRIVGEEFLLI